MTVVSFWEMVGMNVPEKDEAKRGCLGRGLLVSMVIAFAIGLIFLFPDGILTPAERIPCCAVIVLPGSIIWLARYIGKTKRVRICHFGVALLVMAVMFLTCWELDRLVKVSTATTRVLIANDLRQIALALHAYHEEHGRFPPAVVRGPDGTPLYSWRVVILPFLDEEDVYNQFHLDEPWDSPHNLELLPRIPRQYAPAPYTVTPDPTMTFYQVFVGPGTAFEGDQGLRLQVDFPDGTENTFLVVEARDPVPWTKPADLTYAANQSLPPLGAPRHHRTGRLVYGEYMPAEFIAAKADGSVRPFNAAMPEATLRAWITRNGGENIADD